MNQQWKIYLQFQLQYLIETVEPFFKKFGRMDLVVDEYHKRILSPSIVTRAISLNYQQNLQYP